jgi:hypothetical protein
MEQVLCQFYHRPVWDQRHRLHIENTYKYFEMGINLPIKFPAGDICIPLRCSIMIQQVYEFVHLCYK